MAQLFDKIASPKILKIVTVYSPWKKKAHLWLWPISSVFQNSGKSEREWISQVRKFFVTPESSLVGA